MPPMDVSMVNPADVAQMRRIENKLARIIADHRHNTPVEIMCFALVRVLRLLLTAYPPSGRHDLREMLVAYLREQESPRTMDDPAARLLLQ